jgi:hypothetical protein
MRERRINTEDRRQRSEMPRAPFKDSDGNTVVLDRRYFPDRRISHIDNTKSGSGAPDDQSAAG